MPLSEAERKAWGDACNSVLFACAGKSSFDSRALAKEVVQKMLRSKGHKPKYKTAKIGTYRCPYCKKWHIGAQT